MKLKNDSNFLFQIETDEAVIASVHNWDAEGWKEEAEANAKLISAAPEMLLLLKESLEAIKNLGGKQCFDSVEIPCTCTTCKIQAVIKKATE